MGIPVIPKGRSQVGGGRWLTPLCPCKRRRERECFSLREAK